MLVPWDGLAFLLVATGVLLVAMALRNWLRRKRQCCHRAAHTFWRCGICWGGLCDFHTGYGMHTSGVEIRVCPRCIGDVRRLQN